MAFVSCAMSISYATAEKRYGRKGVGSFWHELADMVREHMMKSEQARIAALAGRRPEQSTEERLVEGIRHMQMACVARQIANWRLA